MTRTRGAFASYAGIQKKPVIDRRLLREIGDAAKAENQACARKVALAAAIWDSCVQQTIQVGEHITDAGSYASSEIAGVLGCSKSMADKYSEIGMDLRLRFPTIRMAFEAGELDFLRVRAIYRVTGPYTVTAAQSAESEILDAARRLSPGPLATEVDAILHRIAPEEAAELRKDLARLTGVNYRDKDMIATIEANLEAADAAACWQLINEMAATACPRDPRTRAQRRAAAYTALLHREDHLACTCEPDEDVPCTATPNLPDRRAPLTSVTIDIRTLLGLADLPAYLAGHGDIDAEYARELAENSDLQILLTEAVDLARELGHLTGDAAGSAAETEAPGETTEPVGTSVRPGDSRTGTGVEKQADTGAEKPAATVRPSAHLSFHPLGRGRRRRGMRLPKPSPTVARTTATPPTGPHEGRYTLIAALERAIAADPALAVPLYPDGHGGFDDPPPGALRYRPCTQLAELVRHRDRTCRHPGCDLPAANCEIDHVVPYLHHDPRRGGWTVLTNVHCLCKYHHSLKTMGAWTPTMLAGAVDYWVSNSGTTAITLPGSTVGGSNMPGSDLLPYIPRKRRTVCTTQQTTTTDQTTATETAATQQTTATETAATQQTIATETKPATDTDEAVTATGPASVSVPVSGPETEAEATDTEIADDVPTDADDPAPF
ncbi:HNH endonuclease signature motif containing protein [Rhodococcoides yunnanense]|uniref:HNH endonuclease signature motif containing protein n=1 Tax=Rhodococcoides yunnanense TaxID=278209 RepID=UPI0009349B80|nr:HNH endonuclease signature motif containing protein [Rhodococcus yunnanensis]